ncbi:MAG TPA: type II toxin-antitoxin system RelE/ParE family toxin [Roseiarcus sp.]|nr:type II toxin-antitoxin system RelE/ParE family toxin [Roseiarcus sp.]
MKRYQVVFTPRAERQLSELYSFIVENGSETTAEAFVGGIVGDCLSLATFPERGTRRDDIRPSLRVKGYKRRVSIAFSVDAAAGVVVIHGVFYGGQDFESLLGDTMTDD